ncbi:unnamed protein product [Psylliodes chrysocephalus]|uniref:CRAL-TRIO domain-containing protein n=1 Tax=Psylliodes chrysocephalus TaxID=3402493 RepID=A0A9P0D7T1_9CUCU|nr:unnamed protein product [Psylliodes chrysocephala]
MSLDYKFSAKTVIGDGRTTMQLLDAIKEWIKSLNDKDVPHFIQDELVVLFLTCLDNNIDVTKNSIIAFYKLRKEAPDIFDGRIVCNEDIILALNTMTMIMIPTRTSSNDVILLFKLNDSNYKNFDAISTMKLCFMLMDLTYHGSPPNGLILLVDTEMFGFKHMARLKMDALKKFFTFLQEALPLKLTGFHFLNSNFVLRTLWSMVKVFIKDDVLLKFFLHEPDPKQEQLFKYIPRECLPREYGGDLPGITILQDLTVRKLKANQEFWNKEEALRKEFSLILM